MGHWDSPAEHGGDSQSILRSGQRTFGVDRVRPIRRRLKGQVANAETGHRSVLRSVSTIGSDIHGRVGDPMAENGRGCRPTPTRESKMPTPTRLRSSWSGRRQIPGEAKKKKSLCTPYGVMNHDSERSRAVDPRHVPRDVRAWVLRRRAALVIALRGWPVRACVRACGRAGAWARIRVLLPAGTGGRGRGGANKGERVAGTETPYCTPHKVIIWRSGRMAQCGTAGEPTTT